MSTDLTPLDQPPWSALTTTHAAFALSNDLARRYQPAFAPMAAVREVSEACLTALYHLMQPREVVGLFCPGPVFPSRDLDAIAHKTVEQMVYWKSEPVPVADEAVRLTADDVPAMMDLVKLTNPGPFAVRTIALGTHLGIRHADQLVAMAGERMRFDGFTEISAVCTHPDHRGQGYASTLVRALVRSILARGERPFLHIFSDNTVAEALYRRLGFTHRRSITVTVLKHAGSAPCEA